jgi:hypothetical protein
MFTSAQGIVERAGIVISVVGHLLIEYLLSKVTTTQQKFLPCSTGFN